MTVYLRLPFLNDTRCFLDDFHHICKQFLLCDEAQRVIVMIVHSEQDIEMDALLMEGCQYFFAVCVELVEMDEVNVVEIWH